MTLRRDLYCIHCISYTASAAAPPTRASSQLCFLMRCCSSMRRSSVSLQNQRRRSGQHRRHTRLQLGSTARAHSQGAVGITPSILSAAASWMHRPSARQPSTRQRADREGH